MNSDTFEVFTKIMYIAPLRKPNNSPTSIVDDLLSQHRVSKNFPYPEGFEYTDDE